MWLDNRLRAVVDEINDSNVTIDVGTDHGKVILTALRENRCKKGIASDISRDSLAKAESMADAMNIPLDTRCGDGLKVLGTDEVDTAVIAGMGGKEIVKILSDYTGQIPKLILVPHKDAPLVRDYLVGHNYKIDRDYMVRENNFFYSIIVATIGQGNLSTIERLYGKNDALNEVYRDYLEYRLGVIRDILKKTDRTDFREEEVLINRILRGDTDEK